MRSSVTVIVLLLSVTVVLAACGAPTAPTALPAASTTVPATPTTVPATATPAPPTPTTVRATATVPPVTPTPVAPTPTVPPATPTAASGLRVTLATNPAAPMMGSIQFIVQVNDAKGQPVNDANVKVTATHPGMNMTISGNATAQGNGRYAVQGNLGMGGAWKVKGEVNKSGIPSFTQEFDLDAMDH